MLQFLIWCCFYKQRSKNPIHSTLELFQISFIMVLCSQVYSADASSSTYLSQPDKIKLSIRNTKSRISNKNDIIECVDIAYMKSLDLIFILRSDLCIEVRVVTAKSTINTDTVLHRGYFELDHYYSTIEVSEFEDTPQRLYLVGNQEEIECWTVRKTSSKVDLIKMRNLKAHRDVVKDILVIHTEQFQYLVSASLDNTILLWNGRSLEFSETKSGNHIYTLYIYRHIPTYTCAAIL